MSSPQATFHLRLTGELDPDLVRPAPDRVARKKNETPRVAGLS